MASTRQRIPKELQPGSVLMTFKRPFVYEAPQPSHSSNPSHFFTDNPLNPHSVFFSDLSVEDMDYHPENVALVLVSRSERNTSLGLHPAYRPFLSKLGIFPRKTDFLYNHFFYVTEGPHREFYEKYAFTLEDLRAFSLDESSEYHGASLILLSFLESRRTRVRAPIISESGFLPPLNATIDNDEDELRLFIFPTDHYVNLRFSSYDAETLPLQAHPLCLEVYESMSPEEQDNLLSHTVRPSIYSPGSPFRSWHMLITGLANGCSYHYNKPFNINYTSVFDNGSVFFDPDTPYHFKMSDSNWSQFKEFHRGIGHVPSLPIHFPLFKPSYPARNIPRILL